MAIIIKGKSTCPLCGEIFATGEKTVATMPFIENISHHLWRYSDAAMHYECFQNWECREEFVRMFNQGVGRVVWNNATRQVMDSDGTISVINESDLI